MKVYIIFEKNVYWKENAFDLIRQEDYIFWWKNKINEQMVKKILKSNIDNTNLSIAETIKKFEVWR